MAMTLTPMEQFEVKPLMAEPLFHIGGHPIYFTNQSLLMVIVVIVGVAVPHPDASSRAGWCRRAASPWRKCPTNSSPT